MQDNPQTAIHSDLSLDDYWLAVASMGLCDYTRFMDFEWDETKNASNFVKHGLDFADAWEIFEYPMITKLDERFDYGEDRWVGIGRIQLRIVVVVYTEPDDETIRIISLRKALSHEQAIYETTFSYQLGED